MDDSPLDELSDSEYDIYGRTPPRTKILRKNRERKQREKGTGMASPKAAKAKTQISRRNTVSALYDELIAKADQPEEKRLSKRNLKLLRGSERDLKLDIASAQALVKANSNRDGSPPPTPPPSYQIESCKRFMSLSCRTIQCQKGVHKSEGEKENTETECPQNRVDFYQTLSALVRLGFLDKPERSTKRTLSREEYLWQNEIKDVIWLELQAFHADRTPFEQDEFLCRTRVNVGCLLSEIMQYKFIRSTKKYSTQSSDSGVEDDCNGCTSIYCMSCLEAQNEALRDVEMLLTRLESAESLFPSSKAFAEIFPLYSSKEFVARVKAITLWYNMTKRQRFKLILIGRLLATVENKCFEWPLPYEEVSDSGSPSDSNNSTSSFENLLNHKHDNIDITPIILLMRKKDNSISPYRRYIENMLKTRALNKSLSFLDKLHKSILCQVHLTLQKPKNEEIFNKNEFISESDELVRYGYNSPETKSLNLPSYKPLFYSLAIVPIDVIHEYLRMRLEQKPENPSPLSVRQLMRELKEGLRIATQEKEKIIFYVESLIDISEGSPRPYLKKLEWFDACLLRVFEDYLDYLEQWALLHHETFQKNLLEEEYQFSCNVVKVIPEGGLELFGNKISKILGTILERIGERLMDSIKDLLGDKPKDETMLKPFLFCTCRDIQALFSEEREMCLKTIAFCKMFFRNEALTMKSKLLLREPIISFKCVIPKLIEKVQQIFDFLPSPSLDDMDRIALTSRIREILMQAYRFGFEFYKEMAECIRGAGRPRLVKGMVHFANLWMNFVTQRCERGRGMRPRWANQGLEFLITVCEPQHTKCLSDEEFEAFKRNMDVCISHLIGTTGPGPTTPDSGVYTCSPRSSFEHIRTRSRGSSPSPRPTYKSQRSSRKPVEVSSPNELDGKKEDKNGMSCVRINLPPRTQAERWTEAVDGLEHEIDNKLRKQGLIGKVVSNNGENKTHIRRRYVQFSWQRGIKIGQGRFGKVYTAVNNNTGEMMAVKEIALQLNDSVTIKRIAEEVKILEGIVHKNLVRYYGIEVHKDEMLIFMEFCAEGTLESLIAATEKGLPELIVRRYTFQLVSGVAVLHDHGIVHRDIKTANIFLTDGGNCLKIGDFGCAAKIKSNTTMPGELKGFVGTQAYMAPEVFTRNMSEGHGRAADIWSVGCVVVEMSSGKRPWAQFDSNYQIMFKVGMGESPDPPDDMIDEGLDFIDMCFKHDPKERATAHELLAHNFCKIGDELF